MALVTRIGAVECGVCGYFCAVHKWHIDKPETWSCPKCHVSLRFVRRRKNPLFGLMSNDINSDMYYKTAPVKGEQKVSEANRLEWTYHKIEQLEKQGKTPHVDDFDDMKNQVDIYRKKEQAGIQI
jgi:hypothetical protein